jgi:hypothetical protein
MPYSLHHSSGGAYCKAFSSGTWCRAALTSTCRHSLCRCNLAAPCAAAPKLPAQRPRSLVNRPSGPPNCCTGMARAMACSKLRWASCAAHVNAPGTSQRPAAPVKAAGCSALLQMGCPSRQPRWRAGGDLQHATSPAHALVLMHPLPLEGAQPQRPEATTSGMPLVPTMLQQCPRVGNT